MSLDFAAATVAQLADFYFAPAARWVRSNMVISLDGHYVDADNSSELLSSELDLKILLLLRALSDVVVVGGNTARQENYQPKKCRPEFESIARPLTRVAVVTRSLEFDLTNALFHGQTKPILFTPSASYEAADKARLAELEIVADIVSTPELDGGFVISELSSRGLDRVVCEGGPFMQNFLREAHVLNEMDVTIAPLLMGERNSLPPFGHTQSQLQMHSYARGGEHVFVRYLV